MTPLLLAILAYVALQLAIGFVVSRRIKSEDDYLVAGRSMGPWLATGTIFATWFGAETCLGAAGQAYSEGVSLATAEPFGYGLCIVLMALVFARPLYRLKLTTLADFFRARFSIGVERAAAALMIPTSLLWSAAQVRAFGSVLSSSSALDARWGTTLAAGIVVVYTMSGGLMADAVTDLVQGFCLLVGLAATVFGLVHALGGMDAAVEAVSARPNAFVPADVSLLGLVEAWSVPILGSIVAQELVVRVSAARSERVARRSAFAAGAMYVAVGLVPIALGLAGAKLVPGLEDPELVLPELGHRYLSPVVYALFAGALVSAILSTVDSTLLVCSSLLSHNLILPHFPRASEAQKVRLARYGVLAFGLVAYVLALTGSGVAELVEQASSLGSAGLFVLLVLGLFTRRGGAPSAHAALFGGLAAYLVARLLDCPWPFLASLAAAFAGYLALAGRTPLAHARLGVDGG